MSEFTASVDVRKYPPRDKHAVIFDTLGKLKSGEAMELINDHDPKPLYYELSAEHEEKFEWEYLQNGPELWRVSIKRK
ncbi:uncharacterized protein (DUF2249 family) [Clostridium acetobutylicum]|uniref:DUF2249 domain-containing protein n=1 Tax=Clostridium acetobutylicum (strain ATCC 824 / DSM 792 / JCM 1419 / IAM 19013 / LMG 5710 / NBRC 13948 / NRRL B-527 / VKM B-1787 / 2291 / W) TaxID=272562 RepID=Q97MW8_CLOAB|nr:MULTISPECIES: DUF2249 domain-containing protein [Clostridium]AAK78058.1 Hypothetical protein CA_C0072 [Clostridium acetobutylicum ATCC 824]ADZ19114.1 Conserved hypothetical protein [Clostridium acetobutylicum EA 2018]AEI31051.1 hypothetical protein SMB_G0072 [Clostridium acetobutylicum DSM 1731]AWV81879.1 DUF2249 domain-containing protein [Clostridium acetobutylicum]KHD34965.1 hemerythrin [Clostridium acetobutylicum]